MCNCRPLCIVSSTYGSSRPIFFWQLRNASNADQRHNAGLILAVVVALTGCERNDRMMTGGLHPAGLLSAIRWSKRILLGTSPCHTCGCAEPDRGLRTQQRATGGKKEIQLGTVLRPWWRLWRRGVALRYPEFAPQWRTIARHDHVGHAMA